MNHRPVFTDGPAVESSPRRAVLQRLALGTAVCAGLSLPEARAATRVLRFGVAQPAVGSPPGISGSSVAIAHAKGWLDAALAKEGVRIEWLFFKGAGPAVNEALSNRQLDFAFQGDLPSIIGRAGGLKTKLIAATGVRANVYLAVPPASPIRRVEDLRGKRVSIFKGTNSQLPINRVLEAHGLSERDVRAVNLDTATALAALATGDLDAAFGGLDLLRLRDRNAARIVFSSKGQSPTFTRQSHVLVTEAFAAADPQVTQRVVDAVVRTAHWASDEANRDDVLKLWARAGTPYAHWREDYDGEPLRQRLNPNFDRFLVARYRDAVEQARKFRLTRATFDVDRWIDPQYVTAALAAQKLERFWPALPAVAAPRG